MTVLVVGASGATGRLLVGQLLARGHGVRVIVRSADHLPVDVLNHAGLTLILAGVLELGDDEMRQHVRGCDAVVSCLGHTLTLKGVFGQPRRLVTEATRRLCSAIRAEAVGKPVKFVLMNTTGNSNRDLSEPVSVAQRGVIGLLRLLLPPHADNEDAADYLRTQVGQNDPMIAWVAVRPDGLVDLEAVSAYEVHPSPTRSAIFDAGKTSRINVAHFVAELIDNDEAWQAWRGQMPVIYNREPAA